jgi:hypothetical protein
MLVRTIAVVLLITLRVAVAAGTEGERLWGKALKGHVKGGRVDYAGMRADSAFLGALKAFSAINPKELGKNDRLAFWLNAYNAFTVKLICDHYPVTSIRDVAEKPWDEKFAEIAGTKYSLNQIENDMVRAQFHNPHIHFALVCAAKGCPPLRSEPYTGSHVEKQLDEQTRKFLLDESKNSFDVGAGTLRLSHIFEWYAKDFSDATGSVQAFVARYIPAAAAVTASTPVAYTEYDWSLNGR